MKPITILDFMTDDRLAGKSFKKRLFRADTWFAWRVFLCALFALPFESEAAFELYKRCTGRTKAPTQPFKESFLCCGRRSGKSFVTALVATYCACFVDYSQFLSPGETAIISVNASDRAQSQILLRYIKAFFYGSPILKQMILTDSKESLLLKNGLLVEVLTASHTASRGRTICVALIDEQSFLPPSEDAELLIGLRPSQATISNSLLLGLSSPWGRRGTLYNEVTTHFGKDESETLIWRADSRTMNPTISERVIRNAYAKDSVAAATEWGGEFRSDLESYITREQVMRVVRAGRYELPPIRRTSPYVAFADLSGGKSDAGTLAIAHDEAGVAVLDLLIGVTAPFNPDDAVKRFCDVLHRYNVHEVHSDRYAGNWVSDAFQKNKVTFRASELTRSEIYLNALPILLSQQCQLLDHEQMIQELTGLERTTGRNADIIDHAPNAHDDYANSAMGALNLASGGSMVFGLLELAADFQSGARTLPAERPIESVPDALTRFRQRSLEARVSKLRQANAEYEKIPPCERCDSAACVIRLAAGFHCNQCGDSFGPDMYATFATRSHGLSRIIRRKVTR